MWTPTVLKRVLGQRRVSLNDMKTAGKYLKFLKCMATSNLKNHSFFVAEIINAIKIPDNATIVEIGPGDLYLLIHFIHSYIFHSFKFSFILLILIKFFVIRIGIHF